jgi:hypothetical protein
MLFSFLTVFWYRFNSLVITSNNRYVNIVGFWGIQIFQGYSVKCDYINCSLETRGFILKKEIYIYIVQINDMSLFSWSNLFNLGEYLLFWNYLFLSFKIFEWHLIHGKIVQWQYFANHFSIMRQQGEKKDNLMPVSVEFIFFYVSLFGLIYLANESW